MAKTKVLEPVQEPVLEPEEELVEERKEKESELNDLGDVEFYDEEDVEEELEEEEDPFGIWSAETAKKTGFKVLLYGPSGAGKTRYAATFPKPLFLDLENGLRTTLQVKPVLRFPADPQKQIENVSEVGRFYELVKAEAGKGRFETIVIDSLNELQVLVTKKVLGTYDASRLYGDQMTMQDYGKVNRDFLKIVRMFLKLPYHIVFTAVETPREYEGQEVYPKFTGKQIWPELQRIMEQIGYVHVIKGENGQPEHVVSYKLHPSYVAKSRLSIDERYLPNHFDSLVKYLPE